MSNKLLIGFAIAMLATASAGCSTTDNANTNANANANTAVASDNTRPGPTILKSPPRSMLTE